MSKVIGIVRNEVGVRRSLSDVGFVLNEVDVLLHSPELTVSLWPFFLGWDCMTLKSSLRSR